MSRSFRLTLFSTLLFLSMAGCAQKTCPDLDDGNDCTTDVCSNGVARHLPADLGSTCAMGVCNAIGTCVECVSNLDCAPRVCNLSTSSCAAVAGDCNDGIKNGDETGVDCGGACAPGRTCATNGGCARGGDCASGVCTAGACAAPACGDGVQQSTEGCDDGNRTNGDGCDDGPQGSCRPTGCGNGTKTDAEACDDGNAVNGDGCDLNCTVSRCGNGVVGGSEQCDDGNAMGGDGCSAGCRVEPGYLCTMMPSVCVSSCGDGAVNGAEDCDDGNRQGGDGCSANCSRELGFTCSGTPSVCIATCGDGVPTAIEACDDGNRTDGDGCSVTCEAEPGYFCAGTPSSCVTRCGDSVIAGAEACDDGNITPGDGCTLGCAVEAGYTCTGTPSVCRGVCGDAVKQANEACDDGNTVSGDGCSAACAVEPGSMCSGSPSVCTAICGDGLKGAREGCDDGNTVSGDGCSATCAVEAGYSCAGAPSVCVVQCGDGAKAASEGCDDGNLVNNDGCSATCTVESGFACAGTNPSVCTGVCGDGLLRGQEACDQGNTVSGDGCSATCTQEQGFTCVGQPSVCTSTCGDGVKASTEGCDDGALVSGDGCSSACAVEPGWTCTGTTPSSCVMRAPTCGDGFTDAPEQCDDGNTRSLDGCSAGCRTELTEVEPNEDGTPSTGGTGIAGNDFSVVNANLRVVTLASAGTSGLLAALSPAGDEDVFAVRNDTATPQELRVDLWSRAAGYGAGVACGTSIDTGLHVRNAAGTSLASNDDRNGATDRCSGTTVVVAAGQTVYVHAMEYGDDAVVAAYGIELKWTPIVCGNGAVYTGVEECDDGNTIDTDTCTNTCRINAVAEVEANNTVTQAAANAVQLTGSAFVRGALTPVADVDVFTLTLASASTVRFETFTQPGDCLGGATTTLRLTTGTGTALLTDTTSGIASCSAIVTTLAAGTYAISVEESGNNATLAAYLLEVSVQPVRGAEAEAAGVSGTNDTIATAEAVLVSHVEGVASGDHMLASDTDVWAVTVPAGKALRVELIEGSTAETCEAGGVDSVVRVLNAAGTELAYSDDDGRGACSLLDGTGTSPLDSGLKNTGATAVTWYVQVRGYSTSGVDSQFVYRLQLTVR